MMSIKKQAELLSDFLDRLLGDVCEMGTEEVKALYNEIEPEEDSETILRTLAAAAAAEYQLRGEEVPVHVVAFLEATKEKL